MNKTTCNYCSVDFGKEFDRHWKKKCPRRIDEGYISKIESYDDPSDPKSVRNTIVWVMKRMRSSKFIHSNDLEIAIPFLKETSNVLIGIPEYKLVAQDMNRRFHEMEEWARGSQKIWVGLDEEEIEGGRKGKIEVKVYLDDERPTPLGWIPALWPNEVIDLLKTGSVSEISLDHDLGNDERGTGYDVLLWIEEQVAMNSFIPPKMKVHSANSSARIKMEAAIEKIKRLSDGK